MRRSSLNGREQWEDRAPVGAAQEGALYRGYRPLLARKRRCAAHLQTDLFDVCEGMKIRIEQICFRRQS